MLSHCECMQTLPGSNVECTIDFQDGLNVQWLLTGVRAMRSAHKHWISPHHLQIKKQREFRGGKRLAEMEKRDIMGTQTKEPKYEV